MEPLIEPEIAVQLLQDILPTHLNFLSINYCLKDFDENDLIMIFISKKDGIFCTEIKITNIDILQDRDIQLLRNYNNYIYGEVVFSEMGFGYFFGIPKDDFLKCDITNFKLLD